MENKQEIHFHSLYIQVDEGHHEEIFMSIGTPPKTFDAIQEEAENEFYFAVSEGLESDLKALLLQKLSENGYQKIKVQSSAYYPDPYYMESEFIEEMIQAKEGDAYFDEDFKDRLNRVRTQNGKEPYPIIRKPKPKPKPKPDKITTTIQPPGKIENPLDEFETFLADLNVESKES